METEKKVNQIARTLGKQLISSGISMLRSAFKIKPVEMDFYQFSDLANNLGVAPILLDGKYYLADWETWKAIIKYDWVRELKYVREKFDCENFALTFCSYTGYVYGLNSKGATYGKVYNAKTGKFIDYHYWVAIITNDADGQRRLYWYEPMTGNYVQHQKGKPIIIGNWKYEPINVRFF